MGENDERGFAEHVRRAYRDTPAGDEAAKRRLLGAIRAGRAPRRPPGPLGWLVDPLRLQVRPAAALAGAVTLIAIGILAGLALRPESPRRAPAAPTASSAASGAAFAARGSLSVIRFVIVARGASTVALVGDFNGWDPHATPMRGVRGGGRAAEGAWAVEIPVARGRHVYAFVVDGEHWVADPVAPLAPEDGFGTQSSVIVVGGPGST